MLDKICEADQIILILIWINIYQDSVTLKAAVKSAGSSEQVSHCVEFCLICIWAWSSVKLTPQIQRKEMQERTIKA